MAGKAIVNGVQSSGGFKRGEIVMVTCNVSLLGSYKVNPETLEEWRNYTKSLFDSTGMIALKQIEDAGVFKVKYKAHFSNFYATNFYATNLRVDDKVVAVTEEELNKFCIKL